MARLGHRLGKLLGNVLGLAAIVLILAWLMGAFEQKTPAGPPVRQARSLPEGVQTITVETTTVPVTESAVGTVHPVHRVSVGSKLLARVVRMHVTKAGVAVSKGDVLVELDDTALQASLAQMRAGLDGAQAESAQALLDRDRAKQLYEKRVESKSALDTAETRLQTAQAGVARAEQAVAFAMTQLSYAQVLAPIDGVVIDKQVEQGDLATPGQTLVTLYDPGRMQLVARVRERLALRLAPGKQVAVRIEALDLDCQGVIDQIVPEAETASRVFEVRVTGPCPPGIYAGMFGRLQIPIGSRKELRIPDAAVRRVGQMETVFVVRPDRTVQRRFVQTGRREEDTVEVLSGLVSGEQIVAAAGDLSE